MHPFTWVAVVVLVMSLLLKGLFSPMRFRHIALVLALSFVGLASAEQQGLEKGPVIAIFALILTSLLAVTSTDASDLRKERDKLKEELDRLKIERDTLEKVAEKHHKRGD